MVEIIPTQYPQGIAEGKGRIVIDENEMRFMTKEGEKTISTKNKPSSLYISPDLKSVIMYSNDNAGNLKTEIELDDLSACTVSISEGTAEFTKGKTRFLDTIDIVCENV
jgi:hypothetical protein